jgi:tight adherence protein C
LNIWDPYQSRVRIRISELQGSGAAERLAETAQPSASAAAEAKRAGLVALLAPFQIEDRSKLQQRLNKAGIYHPAAISRLFVARFVLIMLPPAFAIVAAFLKYLPMETALLVGSLAGGFGSIAPSLWLDRAISRRHLLLRKSLPDFLDLMIVCLEGGLSLQETIRRVGDELRIVHPALAFELSIVQRDIELGATVDQALKRFANRSDYEGVRSLSTFIREAQRFGTNITEALRNHADMLRSQREQAAEENAQKASVKILLPTLLLIFPAIFVVLVGPAIIQIQEAFSSP